MPEFGFLGDHRCSLGESPVWDAASERLWWVDARERRISSADGRGNLVSSWHYDKMVGSLGLAVDGLLVALEDGFYAVDVNDGRATAWAQLPTYDGSMRLNDGKCDRDGRYICGETEMAEGATGSLWSLDGRELAEVDDGIRIGNSICFSPDGGTLYFADSLDGFVRVFDYDRSTGKLGVRRADIDVRPFGQAPDGATVDADGNLWIALVLDQAIAQVSPDGALLRRVEVPVPLPSCPAFGGPALDRLYLTSISDSGRRLRSDHPDAGRIMVIDGLGVRGVAETRFAGVPR